MKIMHSFAINPVKPWLTALTILVPAMWLAGCAGLSTSTPSAATLPGTPMQGKMYGGQQPIAGAAIALYAASTGGYGLANTNLLKTAVTTDAGGGFNITGDYSCTAGQQMYIVGTGGNPGGGVNANVALMAALGDCANLSASTDIDMNEVTTVGSVFAMAPFMSGIAGVSTSATNTSGLAHAFASVNKLVNIASGSSPGPALPAGASAPSAQIYALADMLASCINSTGGVAGDDTACGRLFTLTTPVGGTAPTDTIRAALNIAQHPTANVSALYDLIPPGAPFAAQGSAAPQDWTLAVTYSAGGMHGPRSTVVDASGNVWIANAASNSVTVLAHTGTPVQGSPFTGNGLNGPTTIAIDTNGDAWVANTSGATVSAFTASGSALGGSPFSAGNALSAPGALAFDAPGDLWITNNGSASVVELSATGTFLQQVSRGVTGPASVVVNPK